MGIKTLTFGWNGNMDNWLVDRRESCVCFLLSIVRRRRFKFCLFGGKGAFAYMPACIRTRCIIDPYFFGKLIITYIPIFCKTLIT